MNSQMGSLYGKPGRIFQLSLSPEFAIDVISHNISGSTFVDLREKVWTIKTIIE